MRDAAYALDDLSFDVPGKEYYRYRTILEYSACRLRSIATGTELDIDESEIDIRVCRCEAYGVFAGYRVSHAISVGLEELGLRESDDTFVLDEQDLVCSDVDISMIVIPEAERNRL